MSRGGGGSGGGGQQAEAEESSQVGRREGTCPSARARAFTFSRQKNLDKKKKKNVRQKIQVQEEGGTIRKWVGDFWFFWPIWNVFFFSIYFLAASVIICVLTSSERGSLSLSLSKRLSLAYLRYGRLNLNKIVCVRVCIHGR